MSTLSKPFLTPEQYLDIERQGTVKSEYYQGEMFAMAGATTEHIQICRQRHARVGQSPG